MKKIIFSALVIICIIVLSLNVSFGMKEDNQLINFENIEALAQSEGGGGFSHCIGIGTIDCPLAKVKVKVTIH